LNVIITVKLSQTTVDRRWPHKLAAKITHSPAGWRSTTESWHHM